MKWLNYVIARRTLALGLLAILSLAGTSAYPGEMTPARAASPTLHGEIVTLSWEEAGMVNPAEIWQAPLRFTHPMTVTNPQELARVEKRIAQRLEPQCSAWRALRSAADEVLTFAPDPPANMYLMGGYEPNSNSKEQGAILWRSAHAAYACSLVWALTGEEIYAAKAASILDTWAKRDTVFTGKNRGLQLASQFTPMLYAVDLLHSYGGWTSSQRGQFEAFWRRRCLLHIEFVLLRPNNWGDNALMGFMAAAIAFEDDWMARFGLARLNDYFFGNWKIRKDNRGTFLLDEVERNEGRSGISYTAYALQAITQALEMARNFGPQFDWWRRRTTADASMQGLCENFFRWNNLNEPFPWYDENFSEGAPKRVSHRYNILETAHTRLPGLDPRIETWLVENRPVNGREGDPYATLLKGTL